MPKLAKSGRMKPKLKKQPQHCARVTMLGCLVCKGPAEVHHVRTGLQPRDDRRIVGLCAGHHRHGADSFHRLGSSAAFFEAHGIDLVKEAESNWAFSVTEGLDR